MAENVHKLQIGALEEELKSQSAFQKMRSYLKLYTSIGTKKLELFGNEELTLPSMKVKLRQLESTDPSVPSLTKATEKSALDLHFYLEDDETIHVDAPEKARRFENYFLAQTVQSLDIRKEAENINTVV